MTKNTKKFLSNLSGEEQAIFQNLLDIGYAHGLSPQIYASYRTPEEQDALYEKGRTSEDKIVTHAKAWQFMHNYGCAVDIYFLEDGKALWNRQLFACLWALAKKECLNIKGLRWGGEFANFDDPNHFEVSHGMAFKAIAKIKNMGIYA